MPEDLFVYGTLMFPEIVHALTGQKFQTIPATLADHQRHSILIDGEPTTYPAIKPAKGETVTGLALLDLTEHALRIIEYYENTPKEYQKTPIKIITNTGETLHAHTYIALPHLHPYLKGSWNPETFKTHHLKAYTQIHIPQMLEERNHQITNH